MYKMALCLFSFLLFLSNSAHSKDDCVLSLISDTSNVKNDWNVQYSLFSQMSQQQYEDLRRSGGVNAIFKGAPVNANYGEARQYFDSASSELATRLSNIGTTQILQSRLSENAVRAHADCLKLQGDRTILVAWLDSEAEGFVRIAYRWSPSSLEQQALKLFSIQNFQNELNINNELPSPGSIQYIAVPRKVGESLALTFKVGMRQFDSADLRFVQYAMLIPWLPPVRVEREYVERASDNNALLVQWHTEDSGGATIPFIFSAQPGYFIDTESISFEKISFSGGAPGYFGFVKSGDDPSAVLTPNITTKALSGFFRATTPNKHSGFDARARIKWKEWRPVFK